MERAVIGGVEIAYRVSGDGPPLVLIHAAGLADFFRPLADSDLSARFRVISYHRVGYGRSGRAIGEVSIADQAEHCRGLLAHLGHASAHVVGHSSGGVIAIELARRSPDAVGTLALLEPSLPVPSSPQLAMSVMQPAFAAYLAGDKAKAVDTFLAGVGGPDYPALVDDVLPAGARQQAARDADTLFAVEAPSVGRWGFDADLLGELRMPVLSVLGEHSDDVSPVSREAHDLLLSRIPQAEAYVLPAASHFLPLHNPGDLARELGRFADQHPLG